MYIYRCTRCGAVKGESKEYEDWRLGLSYCMECQHVTKTNYEKV